MSSGLALILFFILTAGLVTVPFVPALVEWRKRRDVEPLKVIRESRVDVRHFADRFREFVDRTFGPAIEACRESRNAEHGRLEDGTSYVVLGGGDISGFMDEAIRNGPYRSLVISAGDLSLPGNAMYASEIYSSGSVRGGENGVMRAVLAGEDIHLERDSTTLRWLHGGRSVICEEGCVLFGRASADYSIRVGGNCRFERLHSPRIDFTNDTEEVDIPEWKVFGETDPMEPGDIENRVEEMAGRWLVFGDLEIPAGEFVDNDLVVTGSLSIGRGVRVAGSIKCRKEMRLGMGVEVEGSVVSEDDIRIEPLCRIAGLVLSEKRIFIGEGTVVGSRERLTTVSGGRIFVDQGVRVHGTVWAHLEGRVTAPEPAHPGENGSGSAESR